MISISYSEVNEFYRKHYFKEIWVDQRLGQAFYDYFSLEKLASETCKEMADTLYQLDGKEAYKFIEQITDDSH